MLVCSELCDIDMHPTTKIMLTANTSSITCPEGDKLGPSSFNVVIKLCYLQELLKNCQANEDAKETPHKDPVPPYVFFFFDEIVE